MQLLVAKTAPALVAPWTSKPVPVKLPTSDTLHPDIEQTTMGPTTGRACIQNAHPHTAAQNSHIWSGPSHITSYKKPRHAPLSKPNTIKAQLQQTRQHRCPYASCAAQPAT
jgi:hypothetical protein